MSVALDDFGTGYTSIAYLQEYGFSRIKIDKSLAGRIATDKKAGVLIAGAVYMANGLDMAVTAEGVETDDQAIMLRLGRLPVSARFQVQPAQGPGRPVGGRLDPGQRPDQRRLNV